MHLTGTVLKLSLWASLWAPACSRVGRVAEEAIVCRVWQIDILYENSVGQSFDCVDDDGKAYSLGESSASDLEAGSQVSLLGWKDEENDSITVSANSAIFKVHGHRNLESKYEPREHWDLGGTSEIQAHRDLVQTTGTSLVLVLRVNYRGAVPSLSKVQLAGRVFGLGRNVVGTDFAKQFSRCSFGKLEMNPFRGTGVQNGVADIKITQSVAGSNVKVLQNLVYQEAKRQWKIGGIRHLMLVMPPGLTMNGSRYLAYAYLGSSVSVYNDKFAGQLSALMHEVGHNLNLHHSGEGNSEYGDQSGYLGYGVPTVGGPDMCFNPQKYYSLGWLEDRSVSLDFMDLPWSGSIAPFVHYDSTSSNQFVNLAVGGRVRNRLFLQYNLAESFNDGTQEFPNRITVVTAVEQFGALKSNHVGSFAPSKNGRFRYNNFEGTGYALVIQGCNRVVQDSLVLVRISMYLDDGVQKSSCGGKLVEPGTCENANASAMFFVNTNIGRKNCNWLARKARQSSLWTDRLCKPNHLAYHYCREACGSC